MRKLFVAALIVLFPATMWASPFLVCDSQIGVVTYDVEVNGNVVASGYPAELDGSVRYDLAGQTPGPYTFRLKAIGQGGYPGEWSVPFDATKPGSPLNARISE